MSSTRVVGYKFVMTTTPCFGLKGLSSDCTGTFTAEELAVSPDLVLQCRTCGVCNPARVYQEAVRVDLSDEEMDYAAKIGRKRNKDAKKLKLPDKHGFKGQGDRIHTLGAQAELAFAKFYGVEWDASNLTFKKPDVGNIQVRGRSLRGYDLIIREDDDVTQPFVLVVGKNPFYIMGWTIGDRILVEPLQEFGGREPARFIPAARLLSPKKLLEGKRG